MNKLLLAICIFLVAISCKENTKEPGFSNELCSSVVAFGDVNICFPYINGLQECYSHPTIKERVDPFNDPQNTILAYYIEAGLYDKINTLEGISFDNYYQIYAPNTVKNYTMTQSEMKEIMLMMSSEFLDKTMEEVNDSSILSDVNIEINQPILVEKYIPMARSSSMVILMQINSTTIKKKMAMSLSAILFKERIVFISHYLDYADERTIDELKINTNHFISEFLTLNK